MKLSNPRVPWFILLGLSIFILLVYLTPAFALKPLMEGGLLPLAWLFSVGLILLLTAIKRDRLPSLEAPAVSPPVVPGSLAGRGYLLDRQAFLRHLSGLLCHNQGRGHLLLYIDLDQFNLFNSLYGMEQGDRLLVAVGEVIRRNLPEQAALCWHGEDEFIVVLEQCRLAQGIAVSESIRREVKQLNTRPLFRMTLSMGLVNLEEFKGDISAAINAADIAAHTAKELGRDRLYVACDEAPEMSRRLHQIDSLNELSDAMGDGRLRLFHQPIVPLSEQASRPIHEMLLRAQNREGQWISPGAFLPAVERFGLSLSLDIWVIQRTFQWLCSFPLEQRPRVSINLSGHSLNGFELLELIKSESVMRALNPADICFEVTETAALSDAGQARQLLQELVDLGFVIALDDFGTGHCSYAYLRELPAQYLKIDGVFVRHLEKDPVNQELVASICSMARALGKRTIAEFVETEATLELLRAMGVDYVQGYYLGAPCSIEQYQPVELAAERTGALQAFAPASPELVPSITSSLVH